MMTREQLKAIFQAPFDLQAWQQVLALVFGVTQIRVTPKEIVSNDAKQIKGYELGTLKTSDNYVIGLYAFEVGGKTKIELNRVGLRSLVSGYTKYGVDAAITVYYDSNQWRLSFICDLKQEKTAPKRFTYAFGAPEETYRTASERLAALAGHATFASIREAFSVERLGDEFFAQYKEIYADFVQYATGKRVVKKDGKWEEEKLTPSNRSIMGAFKNAGYADPEKALRDYVKKLMGRLVFLQFLQKKGWMGVPAASTEWKNGDRRYVQNLGQNHTGNDAFLTSILETLFFETLNRKRANDRADKKLGKNIRIPYLNGGLFDKDDTDACAIDFPYIYFSNLFHFFDSYNFTIDENDPEDSEIGIDPEMLGRIFENLLEDNKDKGAFYTPKEIVMYMCRESLKDFLCTHSDDTLHASIDLLLSTGVVDSHLQKKVNADHITKLLTKVKICDPAIGSGAFPMGLLSLIFKARQRLYGFLNSSSPFAPADVKREIIQNNIYGVDLEQGAVDIARLRFWLALVVDEAMPQPLPNLDYKIMQGNSLIESFEGIDLSELGKEVAKNIVAESQRDLFGELEDKQLRIAFESHDEMKLLNAEITNYYKISEHSEKAAAHKRISSTVNNLIEAAFARYEKSLRAEMVYFERESSLDKKQRKKYDSVVSSIADCAMRLGSFKTIRNRPEKPYFLWNVYFNDVLCAGGFDIVIGNPPYLRIQGIRLINPVLADKLAEKYESATGSFDLYACFTEKALSLVSKQGVVNFIMPVKWTNSAFGSGLRKVVSRTKAAYKIVNFGAYQVFKVSTYTGLQWFKHGSTSLKYYELSSDLETNQELGGYLNTLNTNPSTTISSSQLTETAWVLASGDASRLLMKLNKQPRRLSDVFDKIFQGLATSKDDVYFLYDCKFDGAFVHGYSKQLGRIVKIERIFTKPLLKGEDVHRYEALKSDRVVLFPYKLSNKSEATLYTEIEIQNQFPCAHAYLKACEPELRARENGRFNIDNEWFQFGRKQGISCAETEKLVAPEISLGGNFAYDRNGDFYSTTKIYGFIKKCTIEESYKFWLGLLNSNLFWFFIKQTGYVLRGGYFTFKTNYINPFPVPEQFSNCVVTSIENLVDDIMSARGDRKTLESEINHKIYHAYGLTASDVDLIEADCL